MAIIKPKTTTTDKVAQYIAIHPKAKPAEISKALGITIQYVYNIVHKLKKQSAKKAPITKKFIEERLKLAKKEGEMKLVSMSTSNTPMLPFEEESKRIFELTNGRQRMHPVTGKMMMQAAEKPKADNVNHPAHYKVGGVETIDFIEAKNLGYNLGNVVKYITRAGHKNDLVEDLKKARWYLNREISKLDGAEA